MCAFFKIKDSIYEKKKKTSDNELKRYKTQANIGDIC